MREILLQYCVGGVLILLIAALKGREVRRLLRLLLDRSQVGTGAWFRALLDLAFAAAFLTLAIDLFIDPLVAGVAEIKVHAPVSLSTTPENLLVRVVPVGRFGPGGGDRTVFTDFDNTGVAILSVRLEMLESRVAVDVLDRSLPNPVVERRSVYLSPFVRRGLWRRTVDFR